MRWLTGITLSLGAVLGCDAARHDLNDAPSPTVEVAPGEAILPVPAPLGPDPVRAQRAALGAKLFADRELSGDRSVSCATCHALDHGGADGRTFSVGAYGRPTTLNTPTVLNVSLSYRYNWRGQFTTLSAQLDQALREELYIDWPELLSRIRARPDYVAAFAIYPGGITEDAVREALTTYEATLTTPGSRFDRFQLGDTTALTPEERQGYADFRTYGCASCHQGVNVGGNLRQPMGVMEEYRKSTAGPDDRPVFRVPSLRNIALTAPYLHDGSAATLDEAIAIMATYQLGRAIPADSRRRIAAFLATLTGTLEGRELR
jgi:cytochrome c peroxidase